MTLNLGTKIRELRRRDGRTQEDLASALGVSCQAVSRWENDSTFPDMTLIPSIANYFGTKTIVIAVWMQSLRRTVGSVMMITVWMYIWTSD